MLAMIALLARSVKVSYTERLEFMCPDMPPTDDAQLFMSLCRVSPDVRRVWSTRR